MTKELEKKIKSLNDAVTNYRGLITGANLRIKAYNAEYQKKQKELEELIAFRKTVKSDYSNYTSSLSKKRSYVSQALQLKNMKCAKKYGKGMDDRLRGIRATSTDALFKVILAQLDIKIKALQARLTAITTEISAEKASIGDWNGAIKTAKTNINKIKTEEEK